ncbi:alpha/beta fold hydrolase [uncultured Paenibacillus sp.]|uniref:alpha/beta fold hydrolase n=1 Tax=uncultured Paenibacillus sp. TaxID=227322 RepID=UPI0015ABD25B|nr:alpha/beta fold hydrolase [uncultured Paenibacillus sp.]
MPYCKVSQAELYYEEIGSGRPIVLIHGFTPDHRLMSGCMEPVFRERTGWRRIYLDLPGMGRSRDYADIESTDGMLEAVLELIDKLVPESRFTVAGESYGGYLTRGIIARKPERVEGAAFICPVIVPDKERALPPHTVLIEDPALISELTPGEYEDFRAMGVVLNRRNWERYAEEIVPGCRLADAAFLDKIRARYGFSFSVDQVGFGAPSLFLLGRQDATVGYADALRLLERYPRGTFAVMDRAGHNLQIEQEGAFHALMNEWLDRIEEAEEK